MGTAIVKQPDGRLAVFSTVVDSWLLYDADTAEVLDYFIERATEEAIRNTTRAIELAREQGTSAPTNFKATFESLDAIAREHGGDLEQCRRELQ